MVAEAFVEPCEQGDLPGGRGVHVACGDLGGETLVEDVDLVVRASVSVTTCATSSSLPGMAAVAPPSASETSSNNSLTA